MKGSSPPHPFFIIIIILDVWVVANWIYLFIIFNFFCILLTYLIRFFISLSSCDNCLSNFILLLKFLHLFTVLFFPLIRFDFHVSLSYSHLYFAVDVSVIAHDAIFGCLVLSWYVLVSYKLCEWKSVILSRKCWYWGWASTRLQFGCELYWLENSIVFKLFKMAHIYTYFVIPDVDSLICIYLSQ